MKHIFYFIFILLLFIPTAFAGENDPWEFGNTTHTTCYIGGGQGLVDCIGYVNASYFYGDGSHLTGVVINQYNLTKADIINFGFFNDINNFTGTLTNNNFCTYDSTNNIINCSTIDVDTYNTTAQMRAAVVTGISGENITTGTVADARIASTIARDSELPGVNTTAEIQVSIWDTITDAKWCKYTSATDRIDCNVEPVTDTNTYNTSAEMRTAAPTYNLTDANIGAMGYTKDTDTYNTSAEMRTAAPTYNLTDANIGTMGYTKDTDTNTYNTTAQMQVSVWDTITDAKWCKYTSATDRIDCNVEPVTDTNTYNTSVQMRLAAPTYNLTEPDIVDMGFFMNIANFTGTLTGTRLCTYDSGSTSIICDTTSSSDGYNTTAEMQISIWDTITNTKWCKYTSATDRIDCNVEPVTDTNTYNTSAEMRAAAPTYNLSTENVEDIVGGMLDGTETHISVTYDDVGGANIDFVVSDDWWDADGDISADEISESKIGFSTACAAGAYYRLSGNDLECTVPAGGSADGFNTTAEMQISIWDTITDAKWCKYTSATDRIDCDVEPVVDTTYSDGNGISESNEVFSVAGNTALTQDADGLSVTAGGIGDTQIADAYINQALTTTSDVTFNKIIVTTNITTLKCMVFNNGAIIGEPGCV